MRPEDVPNELLLAFINAAMAAGKPVIIQVSAIRAALAAVAPAIEAAALERAAVVAEQLPSPDFIYDWPDAIAAAIRALKETT